MNEWNNLRFLGEQILTGELGVWEAVWAWLALLFGGLALCRGALANLGTTWRVSSWTARQGSRAARGVAAWLRQPSKRALLRAELAEAVERIKRLEVEAAHREDKPSPIPPDPARRRCAVA